MQASAQVSQCYSIAGDVDFIIHVHAPNLRAFERWAEASKQARERGGALVDVRYGHGPLEQLDIFPAQGAAGAALALDGRVLVP